jgi:Leucine-rich repeat (LRR) protein
MTKIPLDIPQEAVQLYLSGNRIESIPEKAFQCLTNLTVLNLSNNQIKRIDDFAFTGLKSLTDINLSNNKLENLSYLSIPELTSLQVLNLAGNPFRNFPNVTYPRSLTELWLSSVCIESAELPYDFQNLNSLRILRLYVGDNVRKIDSNDLKWLPSGIETFDITGGTFIGLGNSTHCPYFRLTEFSWTVMIDSVDVLELEETFESLSRCSMLSLLNLSFLGDVSELPANTFKGLENLDIRDLTLFFRRPSVLREGTFQYFSHLQDDESLVLCFNCEIEDSLSGLTNLTYLGLIYGPLTKLPQFDLPSLQQLEISDQSEPTEEHQVCSGSKFLLLRNLQVLLKLTS